MDDLDAGTLITNPATVIVSLGALCGLWAAIYWGRVARSIDTSGEVVKAPDYRDLGAAAWLSALALFLVCGGFLFGRVTGEF